MEVDISKYRKISHIHYRAFEDFTKDDYPVVINYVDLDSADPTLFNRYERLDFVTKYYCGYVGIPNNHPLYSKSFLDINEGSQVNGGLTFSNFGYKLVGSVPDRYLNHWFFGFDCAHYWNIENPVDIDEVKNQCFDLRDSLIKRGV